MKHFFLLVAILSLFGTSYSFAQTTAPSCAPVTDSNYVSCCNGVGQYTNASACKTYRDAVATFGTFNSTPSSATPQINPINANRYTPSTIITTPQSGAAELQQCTKIKIVSILDILIWIKCIISVAIIPILFALATLFFLWGVLKYIRASDTKNREEALKTVWAGFIGLFVMVSLWGIIAIFGTMFGTGTTVPALQTQYLK